MYLNDIKWKKKFVDVNCRQLPEILILSIRLRDRQSLRLNFRFPNRLPFRLVIEKVIVIVILIIKSNRNRYRNRKIEKSRLLFEFLNFFYQIVIFYCNKRNYF